MSSGKVDLPTWIKSHQPEHVEPAIESTIKYARETLGVKKIGAVGYCFGGKVCTHSPDPKIQSPKIYLINPGANISVKYVCRNMKPGMIDVGYTAHPSFVTHEELGAINGPLSIAAAGELRIARYQFERNING
jgi:hypothetical protein